MKINSPRTISYFIAAAALWGTGCEMPGPAQPRTAAQSEELLSAAHILIMYAGSERAPADVTRTREEALTRAQEVAEKAKAEGADFAALAREYSDGPSAPAGGDLGPFSPDQMVPAFSAAVQELAVGEVSDPVETQFGFHIILRQPVAASD